MSRALEQDVPAPKIFGPTLAFPVALLPTVYTKHQLHGMGS